MQVGALCLLPKVWQAGGLEWCLHNGGLRIGRPDGPGLASCGKQAHSHLTRRTLPQSFNALVACTSGPQATEPAPPFLEICSAHCGRGCTIAAGRQWGPAVSGQARDVALWVCSTGGGAIGALQHLLLPRDGACCCGRMYTLPTRTASTGCSSYLHRITLRQRSVVASKDQVLPVSGGWQE